MYSAYRIKKNFFFLFFGQRRCVCARQHYILDGKTDALWTAGMKKLGKKTREIKTGFTYKNNIGSVFYHFQIQFWMWTIWFVLLLWVDIKLYIDFVNCLKTKFETFGLLNRRIHTYERSHIAYNANTCSISKRRANQTEIKYCWFIFET